MNKKTKAIAIGVLIGGTALFGGLTYNDKEIDTEKAVYTEADKIKATTTVMYGDTYNKSETVDISTISGDEPIGYDNSFGDNEPYYSVSVIELKNKDSKNSYSIKLYDENDKRQLIIDEVLAPNEVVKFDVDVTTRLGTSIVKIK